MATHEPPVVGQTYEAAYPFCRDKQEMFTEDGGTLSVDSWRPGVDQESTGAGDVDSLADAMGAMLLTVVSIHKPGRFPTRVFFTRQWRSPEGREFGKANLRCTTVANFRALLRGYRHPFDVEDRATPITTPDMLKGGRG